MNNVMKPLISCLCVTRKKPLELQRAIDCFLFQTYKDAELVILYEDNDPETRGMLSKIRDPRIRCLEVPTSPKLSLGELRNLSIAEARGEYFCQWDDDDWYHSMRLEVQLESVLRHHKPACYMVFWLIYDMLNGKAYFSIGPWAGSLLCKRSLVREELKYPDMGRHEDYEFLQELIGRQYVFPVVMPSLYIYAYHGNNTFGEDHFNEIFSNSQELPQEAATLFAQIFDGQIPYETACRLLLEKDFLSSINYFYYNNEGEKARKRPEPEYS